MDGDTNIYVAFTRSCADPLPTLSKEPGMSEDAPIGYVKVTRVVAGGEEPPACTDELEYDITDELGIWLCAVRQ